MGILYFLDCETSGLSATKNTILEICIIKHVDRVETDRLYMKIKPTKDDLIKAAKEALKINGYDPELWKDAEEPNIAARRIARFMQGSTYAAIVAHNAKFDVAFIRAFLKRHGVTQKIPFRILDTCTLAYANLEPLGLNSMKMDNIRKFLNWSFKNAHTAEKDAEDVVKLYNLFSPVYDELEKQDIMASLKSQNQD